MASHLVYRCATDPSTLRIEDERLTIVLDKLPLKDRERFHRYRFTKDAHAFLIGRWLPRFFIAKHTDIRIDLRHPIVSSNRGRLYFENLARVDFNGSHDGKYVMLGLVVSPADTIATRIGIDISKIPLDQSQDYQREGLELLSQQFTTRERELYLPTEYEPKEILTPFGKGLEGQLRAMHTLWAIKEAYLKCTGRGLDSDDAMPNIEAESKLTNEQETDGAFLAKSKDHPWSLREEGHILTSWHVRTTWLDDEHVCATVLAPGDHAFRLLPLCFVGAQEILDWVTQEV